MNSTRLVKTIYTFANYDFSKPELLAMGLMSLSSILENFDGEVIVVSSKEVEPFFKPYLSNDRLVFIIEPESFDATPYLHKVNLSKGAHNNIAYKLFQLSRIDRPFLFIDLDTYVFSPFKNLLALISSSDPISVTVDVSHDGRAKDHLNSGVMIVNDPRILNWKELLDLLKEDSFKSQIVGSDQAVIHYYLKKIGYDYLSSLFPLTWNANSLFVNISQVNDSWRGSFVNGTMVDIVHYYGYKPYDSFCPIWYSYLTKLKFSDFRKIKRKKSSLLFRLNGFLHQDAKSEIVLPIGNKFVSSLIKNKTYLKIINSKESSNLIENSNHAYSLAGSSVLSRKLAFYLEEDLERLCRFNKLNNISAELERVISKTSLQKEATFYSFSDVFVSAGKLYFKKGKSYFNLGFDQSSSEDVYQNIQSCFLYEDTIFDLSKVSLEAENKIFTRKLNADEHEYSKLLNINLSSCAYGYVRNLRFIDDPDFSSARIKRLQILRNRLKASIKGKGYDYILLDSKPLRQQLSSNSHRDLLAQCDELGIKIINTEQLRIQELFENLMGASIVIGMDFEDVLPAVIVARAGSTIITLTHELKFDTRIKNYTDSLSMDYAFFLCDADLGKFSIDIQKLSRFFRHIKTTVMQDN